MRVIKTNPYTGEELENPLVIDDDHNLTPEDFNNLTIVKEEKVHHPPHYIWLKELCGIEVIDITRHLDFDIGNAIKYLLRCGHKSEEGYTDTEKAIEDLKKAVFYINDEIEMLESIKHD